ncbi:PucR family transcriptional regulator [Streptomyces ipomoeae]|uniref:PucR family transcriptional regulator n=1 Tax=Streptomyces ipomoeae TaxID=103232 RepID=A0AAE8W6H5_9ACTN|nr:helix-turn-helix domain-containing protein [Streptomyces ipomoeae]TQE38899.1 PucR family transcriptional regulator [Streptomyces ipomoeae]
MPTLEYLIKERPQLRLRFLQPAHSSRFGPTRVTEVVARPMADLQHGLADSSTGNGTLFLVSLDTSAPSRPTAQALDHLIRLLARHKAAGLVLAAHGQDLHALPEPTQAVANSLELPLLTTSAEATAWERVNEDLQVQRARFAERQVEHLDGLLSRLPTRLADPTATRRIADWLSVALDAEVLVTSARRGVLAAAPDSAPAGLAHAVITETHNATPPGPGAMHTRIVSISPGAPDSDDEARLAIASHTPFDTAAATLIQHAAKLLGLCDQARREHRTEVETPRSVRHAAFQLLMRGETVLAQVVYTGAAQALLDTETARVYVVDTGPHDREDTLRWCERALADQAIVSACPGKPKHILVLDPLREHDRVETVLRDLIAERQGHLMGQSRLHPLAETAVGYMEALSAVGNAAATPQRISLGGSEVKFAPLLPRREAKAWAAHLMAPLLNDFTGRGDEQKLLLETLPTALSFKHTEAAGGLGVHRNTVTQRLNRAGKILSLDLRGSMNDRVLTLLALDILALPNPDDDPADPVDAPDFAALMMTGAADGTVKAWAEDRLGPVQADQRDLVETLCVWLENNLSTKETARALGLSEATVRNHTRDAATLLGMDFSTKMIGVHDTDVMTVADIALALHVLLGRPPLTQPPRP